MRRKPVIAIDGPSGAGKSTATSRLAARLGYLHIDTGAMYRTIALSVLRAGVSPDDEEGLCRIVPTVSISFRPEGGHLRVFSGDEDVTPLIRDPDISMLTSTLSSRRVVRDRLLLEQRKLGADGGVVLEGRDIGTVVFPDAEVKFFLTATPEERARRRYLERRSIDGITYESVLRQVVERDIQDETREIAPLRMAEDAILIDSTGRSIDDVVDEMVARVEAVKRRMGGGS
ncbi:MAG: (d)CMP kinase [Desulfuromonadia bacterium]